jgi:hypothetical protein
MLPAHKPFSAPAAIISPMQKLRNARQLLRFAAAWVLLSFCAAWAAPLLAPQSFDLLCTDKGSMRLVKKTADGEEAVQVVEHCSLCAASALATPPAKPVAPAAAPALADALRPTPTAHPALAARAPLPARGPPAVTSL